MRDEAFQLAQERDGWHRLKSRAGGRMWEIAACRHDRLTAELRTADGTIADLGFVGLDDSGPDASHR
ncbi:hypothetical protein [Streptomyces sp. NPDC018000]|uniref:hypothetical protein n=1 Tax=Streptomyces sp. NPDC018000 TaxID=3365028 RepID=UPI0037B46DE8